MSDGAMRLTSALASQAGSAYPEVLCTALALARHLFRPIRGARMRPC